MKSLKRTSCILAILILLLLFNSQLLAQSIIFSGVETTEFPIVKTNFLAFDIDNEIDHDLSPDDFKVYENGLEMTGINVNCDPEIIDDQVSIVLVLDQSTSMNYVDTITNQKRWEWVKAGAKTFINAIEYKERTAMALTSFGAIAMLQCPFTNNKQRLIDTLESIIVAGATNYEPPFLDYRAGVDTLLRQRPVDMRRIVVFLTDGNPNKQPNTDSIVRKLNDANIEVYSIALNIPMNKDLNRISEETGGSSYTVYTKEDLVNTFMLIANEILSGEFCKLSWQSNFICVGDERTRDVEIKYTKPPTDIIKEIIYEAPLNAITSLELSEQELVFNYQGPGETVEMELEISADITDYEINGIEIDPSEVFEFVGFKENVSFPVVLPKGSIVTAIIKYTQQDNISYKHAKLLINAEPCDQNILLKTEDPEIVIWEPEEGSMYSKCDSITIIWDGIEKWIPVDLFYSSDNGLEWKLIVSGASGGTYRWMPPEKSKNLMVKVIVDTNRFFIRRNQGGGPGDDAGLSLALTDDAMNIYVVGYFSDTANFNGTEITSSGGKDIFLVKYNSDGEIVFVETAGGPGDDIASGVCLDDLGNVYVTGSCYQGAQFGSLSPSMQYGNFPYCFLARYSPDGGTPSVALIGAEGTYYQFEARGENIRYEDGIILVRGSYKGEIMYTGGIGLPRSVDQSPMTALFDSNLNLRAAHPVWEDYAVYSTDKVIDINDFIYETGSFQDSQPFGDTILISRGGEDMYLSNYNLFPGSEYISGAFLVGSGLLTSDRDTLYFPGCTVGDSRSFLFEDQINNTGDLPLTITNVEINGLNKEEFTLINNLTDINIDPGESEHLEISCTPLDSGIRTALLTIETECSGTLDIVLKTGLETSVSDNNTGTFEVLSISPVPATDKLTLLIQSTVAGEIEIDIRDRLGGCSYNYKEYLYSGENRILLPVAALQSGMYFLSVKKGKFTKNEKFIVVR